MTDDDLMDMARPFAQDGGRWPSDWVSAMRLAVEAERERCARICEHDYPQYGDYYAEKIRGSDAAPPVAEKKPMTMAEITQEIRRGNVYPGKVWYLAEEEQKNRDARALLDAVATAPTSGDPNKLDRAVVLNGQDGTMRPATDAEQAQYDADHAKNVQILKAEDHG